MKRYDTTLSIRRQAGFSLVELLVYMAILVILMALILASFTQTLQRSAQQSGIAETEIETGLGIGLLRSDLEHAGFGLPWSFPNALDFAEPDGALAALADAPGNVPRALISQHNAGVSLNGADYLVIRATNVTQEAVSQKWGWLGLDNGHNIVVQSLSRDPLARADWVIALNPGNTTDNFNFRSLVMDGPTYAFQANAAAMTNIAPSDNPVNPEDGEKLPLYGISGAAANRPFNRTDYFITDANVRVPAPNANVSIPTHCAPNTGVLVKATLNQNADNFTILPLVDCVADFQVVYLVDNGAGAGNQPVDADGLNGLTPQQIRDQVKQVRCYILIHEGGEDRSYTHPISDIPVGEVGADGALLAGRTFPLAATIGGTWANYRWKVVSITVTPKNLK
ncbi:MAG: type II secretion system GspH family protein [Desulfobulbus sp.]|nr:type II secretion system GspH family protein [Desulfobulbus sp.]